MFFVDRKFRLPRIWSNNELKKIAHLFEGDIVNVSAWKDQDKEGDEFINYFKNKKSYTITNYVTEAYGYQGLDNEIFLDLEQDLPDDLIEKFDVVYNQVTLEHVFNIDKAFKNLCELTKDIVILVVPFLQQMHTDYGDYWRMSPLAVEKMFSKNNLKTLYLTFNDHHKASVYVFAVASKKPNIWQGVIPQYIQKFSSNKVYDGFTHYAGSNAIGNYAYKAKSIFFAIINKINYFFQK